MYYVICRMYCQVVYKVALVMGKVLAINLTEPLVRSVANPRVLLT